MDILASRSTYKREQSKWSFTQLCDTKCHGCVWTVRALHSRMARHCFPTKKVLQQFQGGEQFAVERSGFEVEITFNKPECFEP